MKKKTTCKTGLKKNIIKKNIFDKEIKLCRELSKNEDCCWGKCKDCGVIPLLYKLHNGLLVESKKDVKKLKKHYLNK